MLNEKITLKNNKEINMKKTTLIIASISALLLLSGCGKSPSKVAKAFCENLAEGKMTEAKKYATEQTGQLIDMAASMGAIETNPDYKFVLIDETIDKNRAVVTCEAGPNDGKINLVKIDGDWKVDIKKDE